MTIAKALKIEVGPDGFIMPLSVMFNSSAIADFKERFGDGEGRTTE